MTTVHNSNSFAILLEQSAEFKKTQRKERRREAALKEDEQRILTFLRKLTAIDIMKICGISFEWAKLVTKKLNLKKGT